MTPQPVSPQDQAAFDELREIRNRALQHFLKARELSRERKVLIDRLIATGYSQSDVARELGVTRQAIQKMRTHA